MPCSCLFLYAMKCWKIVSFTTSEPKNMSKNPAKLIPFKTLLHTLLLALSHHICFTCSVFSSILLFTHFLVQNFELILTIPAFYLFC
ncbi:hypothetical protein NC651_015399 [Populus alba x Populus x berolinensis]|nr:hypothetical protein NC651_015399 [Populus alba x Populus x berolinensis]